MKRITITATCRADLTERWTWDVPDDVAARVQALHQLGTSPDTSPDSLPDSGPDIETVITLLDGFEDVCFLGVEDEADNERDRTTQSVQITDPPPAGHTPPYGPGNPTPLFTVTAAQVETSLGRRLRDGEAARISAAFAFSSIPEAAETVLDQFRDPRQQDT